MIEIKNVSYSYSGVKALEKINLKISRGEAVSLLGVNGSGKSTLLKLLNGIITADSGSYFFKEQEITEKKLKDNSFAKRFHQQIAYIFQNSDTQLFCANVFDEIAFGPRQMGFEEAEVDRRVNDCLSLLAIESLKDRPPYNLSGGEKRKVAIACVLSLNPQVLVLDEPLNGLDPRTQRSIVELLLQLNEAGKTIITATHNLEFVPIISQRVILFDQQHNIAADSPVEQLLTDIDLLKRVNLVDEYYHKHDGGQHSHFHMHKF